MSMFKLVSMMIATVGFVGCTNELSTDEVDKALENPPTYAPDNPTCADLGLGTTSYKVEPPESGHYELDGFNTADVTVNGLTFDWSASVPIDAVIVKGGPGANVYTYDPEASAGTGLHAPVNPANNSFYGLSHIDFCFDYEVLVSKTAATSFTRTYAWSLDKSAPTATLTLAAGESYLMPYTVAVTQAGVADSAWAATGTITIVNPAPMVASIHSVTDLLAGDPVAVDCGVTFPYDLAAGATLACTYAVSLADGTNRTNVVDVATCGDVGGGSASASVDFGTATITEVDECYTVTDDQAGPLGTFCAAHTFAYSLQIGPYESCGSTYTFTNVATFTTNDTAATGSDAWTVTTTVPACEVGCTLTPGYWKTHSSYGPAPTDDAWDVLPAGADTDFFLSRESYHHVLWTPPAGNAYYNLAHAYIAAELNVLNGATGTAIATELATAAGLFATYSPAEVRAWKKNSALRAQFIALGSTLDSFNNGLIGPGHCDE